MTDATTSVPPAGWYNDPHGSPAQRWWDGARWTEHVQEPPALPVTTTVPVAAQSAAVPPSAPAVAHPAVPSSGSYNFYDSQKDAARGRNTFAVNALGAGIIGIVLLALPIGLFKGLVPAVAIIWGILGIRRASNSGIGKKRAVWGLILGSFAMVLFLGALIAAGTQPPAAASTYNAKTLQQEIVASSKKQGLDVSGLICPATPTIAEGQTFHCVGTLKDGPNVRFTVNVEDNTGSMTWTLDK